MFFRFTCHLHRLKPKLLPRFPLPPGPLLHRHLLTSSFSIPISTSGPVNPLPMRSLMSATHYFRLQLFNQLLAYWANCLGNSVIASSPLPRDGSLMSLVRLWEEEHLVSNWCHSYCATSEGVRVPCMLMQCLENPFRPALSHSTMPVLFMKHQSVKVHLPSACGPYCLLCPLYLEFSCR